MENNENGRSMVEMLGVLAIIGVLSAGALAGYSKAMFRHKVNQTIDIFQGVLQRFQELDQKGWGRDISVGNTSDEKTTVDIVKYGLMDSCTETVGFANYPACQLPIGSLWMDFLEEDYIFGEFVIKFNDANSCIAFSSINWVNALPIDWWRPNGYILISGQPIYAPNWDEDSVTSVNMTDVIAGCQSTNPYFYLVIRNEY